jgi:guanine deaminase
MMVGKSLFLGSFMQCKSLDMLETWHNAAVFVDENGVIVAIEKECDAKKAGTEVCLKLGWDIEGVTVRSTKTGQFFFPGFIGKFSLPRVHGFCH